MRSPPLTSPCQIGETLQLCHIIVPKDKDAPFADNDAHSRFAQPEEFTFSGSAEMAHMIPHLSRGMAKMALKKTQIKSKEGLGLSGAALAAAASAATPTRANSKGEGTAVAVRT